MKRFWKIVSIALICGMLSTPQIDARGRSNSSPSRSERSNVSRGNTSRPSGNRNSAPKPGGNNGYRPGGDNHNKGPKPGNNNNRPGVNNNHGNHAPAPKPNYGNRPHHAPQGHVSRPHCPPARPYHRPTPPPTFRPHSGCPVLRSIVGITFGTALNLSLDYLNRNGYTVYSYGNDIVYLRNINQYGYIWPDATLYYTTTGLSGSQFMYSTNYYDRSRYNMVYNTLVNQYGSPVSVENVSNGVVATWWGYDGQYVSLEYRPIYTNNGQLRYFTTLSLGV